MADFNSGSSNVTVENSTTWDNLFINGINGTLSPPGNLSSALTAINGSALQNVLAPSHTNVPGRGVLRTRSSLAGRRDIVTRYLQQRAP